MTTRNLARRLERLETRFVPAGEPVVIQVYFVSPDGRRRPLHRSARRSAAKLD